MRLRAFAACAFACAFACANALASSAASPAATARASARPATRAHARTPAVSELTYRGIRIRTSTGEPRVGGDAAYDDTFAVVDNVTLTRGVGEDRRHDVLHFAPAGAATEIPIPQTERRSRIERSVRYGTLVARALTRKWVTLDYRTVGTNATMAGASTEETTTIKYAHPRVEFAIGGPAQTFENWISRSIEISSASLDRKTRIEDDGSVYEVGDGFASSRSLHQDARGGKFHAGTPGFGLYELTIEAPGSAERPATLAVVRNTQGRTVGNVPIVTESFTPPNWYPSGKLGPDNDVVASIGPRRLAPDCGPALATKFAFETIELRSQTRITGEVDADTTTTFARGPLVLCEIDDKKHSEFDPTTGALQLMKSDTEVLHL